VEIATSSGATGRMSLSGLRGNQRDSRSALTKAGRDQPGNNDAEHQKRQRPHRSPATTRPPQSLRMPPTQGRPSNQHRHPRPRTDHIDEAGVIALRVAGRLHHIGVPPRRLPTTATPSVHSTILDAISCIAGATIGRLSLWRSRFPAS
jgi:hypothetical protein